MSLGRPTVIRWLALSLILTCGTAFRIAYNAHTVPDGYIRGDAKSYLLYAHNLLSHSTYSKDRQSPPVPDSYWAPGYPVFLASVLALSGTHRVDEAGFLLFGKEAFDVVLAAQVILGVGTIFLCYLIAASFLPGYWALFPAFLVAISPHLVSTAYYILTETLFGFTLLLTVYLVVKASNSRGFFWWLGAGIAAAITHLVNPVSLLLSPILALTLAWLNVQKPEPHRWQEIFGKLSLLIIPVLVTTAAWEVRNDVAVPVDQLSASDRLLTNLSIGLFPDYHEKWAASTQQSEIAIVLPGSDINTYDEFYLELSNHLSQDPVGVLMWYAIEKPILFLSWNIVVGEGDIYIYKVVRSLYDTSSAALASYVFMKSLHPWLAIAGLLGLFYLCNEDKEKLVTPLLLYVVLLYVGAVYVITQAEPRYSFPLRPELYICATFFLWRTFTLLTTLRQRQQLN